MKEAKKLFKSNLIVCAVALSILLLIVLVGVLDFRSMHLAGIVILAYLIYVLCVLPLIIIISAILTYKSFLTFHDDLKRKKFILGNILCTVGLGLFWLLLYHP